MPSSPCWQARRRWPTTTCGPLVQVSEESPFGPLEACGNFPGEFFGIGVNFVNSEVEPWVEVEPYRL